MVPRLACVSIVLVASVDLLSAKEPQQARESNAMFVGSTGCKSSSCHGGAGEKRSQYITWSRQDFHTKAYAVLLNARSERIAESLGIGAAESSARCTVCHSPLRFVAPSRLARTVQPNEGVSCEACHGAAGNWLRGHTRNDWTYSTRVSAGMRDLRNIYLRANACVACHQNIEGELLQAGHPDLFFELDGQSVAEPKHWRDEQPWNGLREWLTGQAVALREMSWALRNNSQPDRHSIARWDGLTWLCATVTSSGSIPSPVTPPSDNPASEEFSLAQNESDALARRAIEMNWSEPAARTMLGALASLNGEFRAKAKTTDLLAQRAKRLVLALDRLMHALNQNCNGCLTIDSELKQLFQDVRTLDAFDASAFADHLQSLQAKFEKNR